jgi:uncharacterized protein involved in tolerance to divalent cations
VREHSSAHGVTLLVARQNRTGREFLLRIKTTRQRLRELENCVVANHPYDTPEFIVLSINTGNKRYRLSRDQCTSISSMS